MSKLTRILAVLGGTDADDAVVAKGVALAHQQGAALELFLCDAERAYSLLHSYDPICVAAFRRECIRESRRYLECVRDSAVGAGADIPISVDAVCECPLYEAIVRKVVRSRADFVIKSATSMHPLPRFAWDPNDRLLMRLVETLDCDVVLVKPENHHTEVELTEAHVDALLGESEKAPARQPRPASAQGFVSPWQLPAR